MEYQIIFVKKKIKIYLHQQLIKITTIISHQNILTYVMIVLIQAMQS